MENELLNALEEYEKKFGEGFPLFLCMGYSTGRIIAEIKRCVAEGKKYEVPQEEGVAY